MAKAKAAAKEATISELTEKLQASMKNTKVNPALAAPEKKSARTSTWKGFLSAFGGAVLIPVATYKATDCDKIERHTYHSADCLSRVKEGKPVCSGCGEELNRDQVVKGVEIEGQVVLVSDEEIKAQMPVNDQLISTTKFVSPETLDVTYYESSEFIAPRDGGNQHFLEFQQALARTGKVAIGSYISRGRQYHVAIRPKGDNGLIMSYLFAEYEIRECGKWVSAPVNEEAVQLMARLMEAEEFSSDQFVPAPYDPFLANTRAMVAKKAKGEVVEIPKKAAVPQGGDMLAALKETLKNMKSKGAGVGKR